MNIFKKTVYLPVKVEDVKSELKDGYDYIVKDETGSVHQHYWSDGEFYAPKGKKVVEVIQPQEAFVFIPEQLNEYTSNVIKKALENAANNAQCDFDEGGPTEFVNTKSITNTFEETFNEFKV